MNIGQLASEAVVALLTAATLATVENLYAEVEDPENADGTPRTRNLPCVVCWFSDADEYPMATGNYSGVLNVRVEASADDEDASEFYDICDEVFAEISTTTFLADLSAAKVGFVANGYTDGLRQPVQETKGRIRTKTIAVPINCGAVD